MMISYICSEKLKQYTLEVPDKLKEESVLFWIKQTNKYVIEHHEKTIGCCSSPIVIDGTVLGALDGNDAIEILNYTFNGEGMIEDN